MKFFFLLLLLLSPFGFFWLCIICLRDIIHVHDFSYHLCTWWIWHHMSSPPILAHISNSKLPWYLWFLWHGHHPMPFWNVESWNLLQPARLLCPWNFPGKNTGVRCHSLLWENFPGIEFIFLTSPAGQADPFPLTNWEALKVLYYILIYWLLY